MGATIKIAILANAAAAKAEMAGASKSAQDMQTSMSGAGEKMGAVLKAGALAGVAGLGMLAKSGLDTAAEMEQAQISFTTMLKSGEKAQKFIADLSAFAAQTPFDFPGLQEAASSLISAGVDSQKVIPIMKTLGDVTSGMGTGAEGIQRATVALQQMQAAQKISGEDLNQLRDAGIPVYDLLASATGKSKAEIVKLAAAGKLGKKELDALMQGLESGKGLERFSGLMEQQSQSLTGVMSTLKDNFSMGLAKAMQPAIPKIKQIVGDVGNVLPGIFAKVIAFFTAAMPTISAAFDIAKVAVTGLFAVLQNPVFQSVAAAILAMVAAWKVYQTYLAIVSAITKAYAAIQVALNIAMTANPIGLIVLAIVGLVAALVVAYKNSETFRDIVTGVWNAVKSVVSAVVGWFVAFLPKMGAVASAVWNAIKAAASVVWNAIKTVVGLVITGITLYINAYKTVVLAVWSVISAAASIVWNAIKAVVSGAITGATAVVNGLKTTALAVWNGIKTGATTAWNAITGAIQTVVTKITGFITGIKTTITGIFSNSATLLSDAGRKVIDGLWNGLKQKWEDVKKWFADVTKNIPDLKGPASRDAKLLRENGQLVIQGFKNGLEDQYGAVRASLGRFTNDLSATTADVNGTVNISGSGGALGSSKNPITIEFKATGDQVMDAIFESLRNRIRVRGGNVQTVLGRA